jgi:transcription initiation factor TFIID subunit 5
VYSFLTLAKEDKAAQSERFFNTFKVLFEPSYGEELQRLATIRLSEHIDTNDVAQIYLRAKYRITLSATPYYSLLAYLQSKHTEGGAFVLKILINRCTFNVVKRDPIDPRSLAGLLSRSGQDQEMPVEEEGIPGYHSSLINDNEGTTEGNALLRLGGLPMEPELMADVQAELEEEDAKAPPAEGQHTFAEEWERYIKREPSDDAPPRLEIPLPPSLARDVAMEVQKVKQHRNRFKIQKLPNDAWPGTSVVMYTFHNTQDRYGSFQLSRGQLEVCMADANDFASFNCIDFSDDHMFVAVGTMDSYIRVWTLDGSKIPSMMPPGPTEPPPSSSRKLIGHSGAVFGVSWSPAVANYDANPAQSDDTPHTRPRYLLSASEDKTVRLWSADLWTCLVAYKGHDRPVWDVRWGPFGHYFATGGNDRVARLFSTEHIASLRMFVGHDDDVTVVAFHPNSAYVFTGSGDRSVRMWAAHTGDCVRILRGHRGRVTSVECSHGGKLLASADDTGHILVWDLVAGGRPKRMRGHGAGGIWSLSWSVEDTVLVSGGADNTVRVWDVAADTTAIASPTSATAEAGQGAKQAASGAAGDGAAGGGDGPSADVSAAGGGGGTSASAPAASGAGAGAASGSGGGIGAGAGGVGGSGKKKGKEVEVTPDQIAAFMTKKTPVFKVKFTTMNLVLAGGVFSP